MRVELTLDCNDLTLQSRFWAAALDGEAEPVVPGRYVAVSSGPVSLTLQAVPEPKTAKNRLHLDLLVADVAAEVSRLETLGATRTTPQAREEYGQVWYVLADPEGNEFCVGTLRAGGEDIRVGT